MSKQLLDGHFRSGPAVSKTVRKAGEASWLGLSPPSTAYSSSQLWRNKPPRRSTTQRAGRSEVKAKPLRPVRGTYLTRHMGPGHSRWPWGVWAPWAQLPWDPGSTARQITGLSERRGTG